MFCTYIASQFSEMRRIRFSATDDEIVVALFVFTSWILYSVIFVFRRLFRLFRHGDRFRRFTLQASHISHGIIVFSVFLLLFSSELMDETGCCDGVSERHLAPWNCGEGGGGGGESGSGEFRLPVERSVDPTADNLMPKTETDRRNYRSCWSSFKSM